MRFIKSCTFIFLLIVGIFSFTHQAKAIGVSPSYMEVEAMPNGLVIDKKVYLSRGNPNKDEMYKVKVEGQGAKYIHLFQDTVKLPKGEQQVGFNFQIKPVGAASGTYSVNIVFNGASPSGESGDSSAGVSVLTGVTAQVKFTISDKQISDFKILDVYYDEVEVNQPFTFYFLVKNSGNVDAKVDSIQVVLVDQSDANHVITESIPSDKIPLVPAFQEQKIFGRLLTPIPQGKYDGKITFIAADKGIFSKAMFVNVLPAGTLNQKIDITKFEVLNPIEDLGKPIRFNVSAQNNGQVAVEPILTVQIAKDGNILDFLRTEKRLIIKGSIETFPLSYTPTEKGTYKATASMEYGVRKSDPKEVTFTVGRDYTLYYIIGISIFFLLLLILILLLISRRKKRKEKEQMTPPPVAPSAPTSAPAPAPAASGAVNTANNQINPPAPAVSVPPSASTPTAPNTTNIPQNKV